MSTIHILTQVDTEGIATPSVSIDSTPVYGKWDIEIKEVKPPLHDRLLPSQRLALLSRTGYEIVMKAPLVPDADDVAFSGYRDAVPDKVQLAIDPARELATARHRLEQLDTHPQVRSVQQADNLRIAISNATAAIERAERLLAQG